MNNKKTKTNNNLKINQETTKRNTKWWNGGTESWRMYEVSEKN